MGIYFYKPYTAGTRNRSISDFKEITTSKPESTLTCSWPNAAGRNNRGVITSRHRGGGHKRLYRHIDFRRNKYSTSGKIVSIEYDPYRNGYIALLHYQDGQKKYILYPRGLEIGNIVVSAIDAPIAVGNALPLSRMPLGAEIHNIESFPGSGGQFVRSAGTVAQLVAKEGNFVAIRLPSKEVRLVSNLCWATLGQVGNIDAMNLTLGKAGRKRWLGQRPKVRGVVMNAADHPHGGGEGRTPIGRSHPVSPWGRPALGQRTRNPKKKSSKYILRRRPS